MRLILGTDVLQSSNRHMRISRGDVVTASTKASRDLYVPRNLDLLIHEREDALYRPAKIWSWQFHNATVQIAEQLHEALFRCPSYLGAMELDFSEALHLRCFRNSLPEAYRVMGRRCWLFYHMGESWAVDTATREIFEQYGFVVDTEDLGARRTVFDNYDGLEHFRRVADFNSVFARIEGLDVDRVSDLALLLEEIHPKLFDALASAARTIERAETAEDLAQAALSGRRLLERIADYLYPPRNGKRRGRDVGPDKYKNRLWAYIEDTLAETGLEDSSILPRLGKEADRLVDLFNSGLHHDPGREKVEGAFRDLVIWLTKAIQISPTHARKAYLAYENDIGQFMRRIVDSKL
ncbi:MAG: hypothetical protein LAO79_13555 [Acidobacteriia bacterium]|nr:hypothetical protein [Terriglobia bacterium]